MGAVKARITSKGQITLPKILRDSLALREGDYLEFTFDANNEARVRKLGRPFSSLGALSHLAGKQSVSVEDMDEGIQRRMRERYGERRRKG